MTRQDMGTYFIFPSIRMPGLAGYWAPTFGPEWPISSLLSTYDPGLCGQCATTLPFVSWVAVVVLFKEEGVAIVCPASVLDVRLDQGYKLGYCLITLRF